MKTIRAYFDTNPLLDLAKKRNGITAAHVRSLRRAVRREKVSIILSIHNVEELVARIEESPDECERELRFVLELADRQSFIKPAREIIPDAVRSCLEGRKPEPLLVKNESIWQGLDQLLSPALDDGLDFIAVMQKTRDQSREFLQSRLEDQSAFQQLSKENVDKEK